MWEGEGMPMAGVGGPRGGDAHGRGRLPMVQERKGSTVIGYGDGCTTPNLVKPTESCTLKQV